MIQTWRAKVRQLKLEIVALYYATRHPQTPWAAKLLALLVVGYALSPIDLIPDFIPVLGYLDDLILLPLGILLVLKLIPTSVLDECRQQAQNRIDVAKPLRWVVGGVIVLVWGFVVFLIVWAVFRP